METIIHFDGACWNDKDLGGIMGTGVVALVKGKVIVEEADYAEYMGNSFISEWIAAYRACKVALQLTKLGYTSFRFFGDAQVIVRQITGEYSTSDKHIKYYNQVIEILNQLPKYTIAHVPRELNTLADDLSKIGRQMFISYD